MIDRTPLRATEPGPSRRTFLAGSAALAGTAPLLAARATQNPAPATAKRAKLSGDEPIRIGVIGVGGMGHAHCDRIMALAEKGRERVHIAAICDVNQLRREAVRDQCASKQKIDVTAYLDYHELLGRDDLHGVLIASPEHWHAKMAEHAIAAGKDIYLEKPMTLRLEDALQLYRTKKAHPDTILQIGTQFTMQQKYHEARKLIAEGAIGKPTFSQTSYCRNSKHGEWLYGLNDKWDPAVNIDWKRWCGPAGEAPWDPLVYARWRRYRKYSSGIVGDLLVHVMTPLMFALDRGWPTRVVACGGHYVDKEMENHDQVNLTVQFEKEHTLVVAGSTCNEKGVELMIRGHQATIYLGSKDCVLRPERQFAEEIDEQTIKCKSVADQDELRLDWLSSIRTRKPNLNQVDLATQVMVVVDLATRSMWEGHAFAFDPETMTASPV